VHTTKKNTEGLVVGSDGVGVAVDVDKLNYMVLSVD
jgi:hypothetical protein